MCAYNTIPPPVSRPDFKFSHFCLILYSLGRPILDTSRFADGRGGGNFSGARRIQGRRSRLFHRAPRGTGDVKSPQISPKHKKYPACLFRQTGYFVCLWSKFSLGGRAYPLRAPFWGGGAAAGEMPAAVWRLTCTARPGGSGARNEPLQPSGCRRTASWRGRGRRGSDGCNESR